MPLPPTFASPLQKPEDNKPSVSSGHLADIIYYAVLVSLAAFVILYLVFPVTPASPATPSVPRGARMDWFLIRDISSSVYADAYKTLEDKVIAHIRPGSQSDRNTYAVFGSDTYIPPPSADVISDAERKRLVDDAHYCCSTDFEKLFLKLRDAIYAERKAQPDTHSDDAIVIFSDGIPNSNNGPNPACIAANPAFNNSGIADALDELVGSKYDAPGKVYVRLILHGRNPACDRAYRQAWQVYLNTFNFNQKHPGAFSALAACEKDDFSAIANGLLIPGRRPQIVLTLLPLLDRERRALDKSGIFAVQYEAHSFLAGGTITIGHAALRKALTPSDTNSHSELTAEDEPISLHVFKDRNRPPPLDPVKPTNVVAITVGPPSGQELVNAIEPDSIYMKPAETGAGGISPFNRYELTLTYECGVYVDVTTLPVDISGDAAAFQAKILIIAVAYAVIMVLLVAAKLFSGSGGRGGKIFARCRGFIFGNWRWLALLLALFLPAVIVAAIRLRSRGFIIVLVLVLGMLPVALRAHRDKKLVGILCTGADLAVPLLWAIVAAYVV